MLARVERLVFGAFDPKAGAVGSLLLLRGGAMAVMALARRLPRLPGSFLPLAVANLHRPGAPTPPCQAFATATVTGFIVGYLLS